MNVIILYFFLSVIIRIILSLAHSLREKMGFDFCVFLALKNLGLNIGLKAFWYTNTIVIPENFITNISNQLFDYKITFLNPQH